MIFFCYGKDGWRSKYRSITNIRLFYRRLKRAIFWDGRGCCPLFFGHFDARAEQDTRVIALNGRCNRAECESHHTLGHEMLKRFAQIMEKRLEATRMQLLDVYGKT